MFHLEIPKRASCCSKGGEHLEHGSEYFSALVKSDQEEALERLDYCSACWMKGLDFNPASSWRSMVPLKKESSELPKRRDDRALFLLKKALASPECQKAAAEAFVLALYLVRRRLLFLRQEMEREEKPPLCIYEVADTEEMVCVPKIPLVSLDVEKMQLELAKKFHAK